jgi:hypothetical protein
MFRIFTYMTLVADLGGLGLRRPPEGTGTAARRRAAAIP